MHCTTLNILYLSVFIQLCLWTMLSQKNIFQNKFFWPIIFQRHSCQVKFKYKIPNTLGHGYMFINLKYITLKEYFLWKTKKNNLVIFACLYWNPILLLYRLPLVTSVTSPQNLLFTLLPKSPSARVHLTQDATFNNIRFGLILDNLSSFKSSIYHFFKSYQVKDELDLEYPSKSGNFI